MTETLRDKLIRCGWASNFSVDTLVQLIERHYAALAADGPAVPEGREPAAVAREISDEELERRFQVWWYDEGSGMPPCADEDHAEHVHRVSQIAWHNGAYCARWGRPPRL